MQRDKRLCKSYKQYEKECMEDARDILGDILVEQPSDESGSIWM